MTSSLHVVKYYHPGHIETCHETPINDENILKWYKNRIPNCTQRYLYNLEHGRFIPCGNSGSILYMFLNDKLDVGNTTSKHYPCCFVYGQTCHEAKLLRRWTCCDQEQHSDLHDMIKIRGCQKVTFLNDELVADQKRENVSHSETLLF